MAFNKESEFEEALIKMLTESCGWEPQVLKYKNEKELIQNWADILFENNRSIDKLNDYPLTEGEMQQIIEEINNLRTPLKLNGFINGKNVTITRDNPDDKAHFGKNVSLKIYDRQEIAAGQSRYQIAQQPKYKAKTSILPDRRGDFVLLINGMPVIHVELKKSGIPVSQACNQIEKYSAEGVFTGFFSLVQVFVAMNPEETVYFANPGNDGKFNKNFYFHWADFYNEPINNWKDIASSLLSIPMAHQLIGFYTVADDSDGILKVMRSYQYYAANKISDTVSKHKWESGNQLGGYIWHTTGSGKTMTSFKSAQLIANSKDADKVVFLIDRIELGTQSAGEYRSFADETESIQETEDTSVLISKLRSSDPADTLIVTSIQKMSNINEEADGRLKKADIDAIISKRIVFIVDECHRSSFGDMMAVVKKTFSKALFFGFSGTPIQVENEKKGCTTSDVFGNELHRYSIADGIRDKNVLGFDPYLVETFREKDIREAIVKSEAKVSSIDEIWGDAKKEKIYHYFMKEVPMAGSRSEAGKYIKGIEDYLKENGQYLTDEHRNKVVEDIVENWITISHNNTFHGMFATSSISEAMVYYRKIKKAAPWLNVTALFDPSIDNNGTGIEKGESLEEIINDYNEKYNLSFNISTFQKMKKDIQNRLAHKKPYERIEKDHNEQLDLLIVVDQMLTGYDSKWINVLYLDKVLKYENIIQAFSRTNRLFGEYKPFGTIKYYRMPFTMKQNIEAAVKLYSGDKPMGMFVVKLNKNIENMNAVFTEIKNLYASTGIVNFAKLPTETVEKKKFASLFNEFNNYLRAAIVQGFTWDKDKYTFIDEKTGESYEVGFISDEKTYLILVQRYKELSSTSSESAGGEVPYDIDGYITTISTDDIDVDYMNSRFEKFKIAIKSGDPHEVEIVRAELHKTFAALTQEEQKYANIFLHDIQTGDTDIQQGKTLRDYINEYMERAQNDRIHKLSETLGINEKMLRDIMALNIDEKNINEYGRLDNLKKTVDIQRAKAYFETVEGKPVSVPKVNIKTDKLLRKFILEDGFDIEIPNK